MVYKTYRQLTGTNYYTNHLGKNQINALKKKFSFSKKTKKATKNEFSNILATNYNKETG